MGWKQTRSFFKVAVLKKPIVLNVFVLELDGRPFLARSYSKIIYLNTKLSKHILPRSRKVSFNPKPRWWRSTVYILSASNTKPSDCSIHKRDGMEAKHGVQRQRCPKPTVLIKSTWYLCLRKIALKKWRLSARKTRSLHSILESSLIYAWHWQRFFYRKQIHCQANTWISNAFLLAK